MIGYNHLLDNLTELSEAQLLERMQTIYNNTNRAYALGKNDLAFQLNVAIDMCREEMTRRQREQSKKSTGPDPFKSIDIG
jgi:hypothetical protein